MGPSAPPPKPEEKTEKDPGKEKPERGKNAFEMRVIMPELKTRLSAPAIQWSFYLVVSWHVTARAPCRLLPKR
jgi:hypothetical protein